MPKISIKCKRCGVEEELTPKDRAFYKSHGFVLPSHCKACRKIRREEKAQSEKDK